MRSTRLLWILSAILGVIVWVIIAFDLAFFGKLVSFLLVAAAHGCLAVLIVAGFYVIRAARSQVISKDMLVGATFALCSVLLAIALFKVGQSFIALPVDSGWKALYVGLAASSFWVAFGIAVGVFSPSVNFGGIVGIAAHALMSLVTTVATVSLLVVIFAHFARARQNDADDDRIVVPVIETLRDGLYVALGDSYSAGEGLGPFQSGTAEGVDEGPPACHRSDRAYPMLLEFSSGNVTLDFRACSGAITADIDRPQVSDRDHPPQLDATERSDVSLVTITVGGNDASFSRVVQACFFFENCLTAEFEAPSQEDDRRRVIFPGREPLHNWSADALELLERNVTRVYAEIASTYPEARIVVVGYPYLFPDGPAPDWKPGSDWQNDCVVVLRRVSEEERDALRDLTDLLNLRLFQLATRAGLEFISPAEAWDGHEPCGAEGQYTNALKPFGDRWNPLDGGSFHPNEQGQRALARLIACYLNTVPMPPTTAPGDALPVSPICPDEGTR